MASGTRFQPVMLAPSAGSIRFILPVSIAELGDSSENASCMPSLLVGRDAHLRVAHEDHAARSPVVDGVREHIDVHEVRVRLPDAVHARLGPGVEPVDLRAAIGAEEVEAEVGLDHAERRRNEGLEAQAGLPHAEERRAVLAASRRTRADDRNLRRPQGGVPVGIHPPEVVDGVEHGLAVELGPACPKRVRHLRRAWRLALVPGMEAVLASAATGGAAAEAGRCCSSVSTRAFRSWIVFMAWSSIDWARIGLRLRGAARASATATPVAWRFISSPPAVFCASLHALAGARIEIHQWRRGGEALRFVVGNDDSQSARSRVI